MFETENRKNDDLNNKEQAEHSEIQPDINTKDSDDVHENAQNENKTEEKSAEYAFKWDYVTEDKMKKAQKRSDKKGLRAYALVMTFAFIFCAVALAALLVIDHYKNDVIIRDRTVFVREYNSESGVLTIPEISEKVKKSVVGINVKTSSGNSVGTGIIMTEDGYIATNYHIIGNESSVSVVDFDGKEYDAKVIGIDALSNLAVIKIDAKGLSAAEFGDSDSLIVGELAVAVGTTFDNEFSEFVMSGIISATNRRVNIYDKNTGNLQKTMKLIVASTTVTSGSSGGPLANEYGQVIGIITPDLDDGDDGMAFAIPITAALESLNKIIETGENISENATGVASKRAILGISGKAVSSLGGYSTSGVLVVEVNEGYDAVNHLIPGDIIIGIDGNEVLSINDISAVLSSKTAGDTVTLKISRNGKVSDVTVELGFEK